MNFIQIKEIVKKILWLIKFKFRFPNSPKFIITSYEHRKLIYHVKNPNLIIDIGFNRGQFSSLALEFWPNTPLIAFDPHPTASKNAVINLKNKYPDFFVFKNKGISSKDFKTKEFFLAKKSDNSSFLEPTNLNNNLFAKTKISKKQICEIAKLKNEISIEDYKKDWLLKIDVQGSELDVLKSISKNQYKKIKWIYIEVTDFLLYKNQSSSFEIREFLVSMGFKLIHSFNENFMKGKLLYADFLFTKS